MRKDIESDLLAVQTYTGNMDLCSKILKKITFLNVPEMSDPVDRKNVADLFYYTLKAIQNTENDSTIEQFYDDTISAFENINQIAMDEGGKEGSEENEENSSFVIIRFLNKLYMFRYNSSLKIELTSHELLVLLNDLEPVKFVLNICDSKGKRYFPINNLLSNIISDSSFIKTKVEPYHINLIQLAVEMFKATNEDETSQFNEKIKELIDRYNLKFINYLDGGSCERVDTMDMCNFRNNQVMVFLDIGKGRVLIRNEEKTYFSRAAESYEVFEEHNVKEQPIGYFVELDVQGTAIDYTTAIKESPKEFLKLLFDEDCKNVFINHMIQKTAEGKLLPLNPFCKNDKFVVKGHTDSINGKVYSPNRVIDCLEEGRLQLFSTSDKHAVIDQVSLGLCMALLEKSKVEIDVLFDDLKEDDWLQNIIISNWSNKQKDVSEAIEFVLDKYKKDLDYCDKEKDIEEVKFETGRIRDSLPYSFNLKWIYDALNMPETPSIFLGTINERTEDLFDIDFLPLANDTLAKRNIPDIKYISSSDVLLSDETDPKEFYVDGLNRYFVCKDGNWFSSSDLQNLYKLISLIELGNERMLSYEISSLVKPTAFEKIKSIAMLYEDELTDISIREVDTESLIKIRLVNNLLFNKIDSSTWQYYFNLFSKQQILKFDKIKECKEFSTHDNGVLVVPKDRFQEDAVLNAVYRKYLKAYAKRDDYWWYFETELTEDNNEYYLNGEKIKKIRFLFDNTERGTATIKALAAYLGKEDEWVQFESKRTGRPEDVLRRDYEKQKKKCQQYKCNDSFVELAKIITQNNPDVETCSYYGTSEGKKTITDFLVSCGFDEEKINIYQAHEITKKAEDVKEECERLKLDYNRNKNIYIVIREFNMTKRYLLPLGAVGDANRIVTLLAKKEEV